MQGEYKYEILVQHRSGHVKVKIFLIDDMYGRVEIYDLPILRYACGFLHKEKYLQDGEYKKVKVSDLLRFAITEGVV